VIRLRHAQPTVREGLLSRTWLSCRNHPAMISLQQNEAQRTHGTFIVSKNPYRTFGKV
jgi:hypothetical protein